MQFIFHIIFEMSKPLVSCDATHPNVHKNIKKKKSLFICNDHISYTTNILVTTLHYAHFFNKGATWPPVGPFDFLFLF